jgi:hypothetical protein
MKLFGKKILGGPFLVLAFCSLCALMSGCGGGGGGGGSSTPVAPAAPDTTAPSLAFAYPAHNAEFTANALPSFVQINYSDAVGLDLSTLNVTMTLNGGTVNLTPLFATDSVQNAASTRTPASETSPLHRTVVMRYARADTAFSSVTGTAAVPRGTASTMAVECLDSAGRAMVWSEGLSSAFVLPASGAFMASEIALGFAPVAAAAADGVIYTARDGFSQLFGFNADTGSVASIISLPHEPSLLVWHRETGMMYAAYEDPAALKVSRIDIAQGAVDQTIPTTYTPALLGVRTGSADGGVFAAGASAGQFRLFPYDNNGTLGQAAALGLTQPGALAFDAASGNVYLSRFDTNSLTRAEPSGAVTDISVGANPRAVFPLSSGGVFAINSGGKSVSRVVGAALAGTVSFQALPLAGLAACGADYTYLVMDLWSLDTRTAGTLTATIRDRAGNTATASITLYFSPEPVVPLRLASK